MLVILTKAREAGFFVLSAIKRTELKYHNWALNIPKCLPLGEDKIYSPSSLLLWRIEVQHEVQLGDKIVEVTAEYLYIAFA